MLIIYFHTIFSVGWIEIGAFHYFFNKYIWVLMTIPTEPSRTSSYGGRSGILSRNHNTECLIFGNLAVMFREFIFCRKLYKSTSTFYLWNVLISISVSLCPPLSRALGYHSKLISRVWLRPFLRNTSHEIIALFQSINIQKID